MFSFLAAVFGQLLRNSREKVLHEWASVETRASSLTGGLEGAEPDWLRLVLGFDPFCQSLWVSQMPMEVSISLLLASNNLDCANENTDRQIARLAPKLGEKLCLGRLRAGVDVNALSDESADAAILNLLGAA